MPVPASFISVCERYASNTATETDLSILHSLSMNTPLPLSIPPLEYGFNPETRLPDDPGPFHNAKNHIRASAHASRQEAQVAALHAHINNPPTGASPFPNTLASFPLQAGVKCALRRAISEGCAVEWRVAPLLLLNAERFISAVRHIGFDVEFDNEEFHVVFTLGKGNDYLMLWQLLAIRDGNTLPAGEVNIVGPRKTACGSWVVRTVLRIV